MGYDMELCQLCLQAFTNDLNKAINFFLENKDALADVAFIKTKLNSIIRNMDISSHHDQQKQLEKALNAKNLLNSITKDIPDDDEAYLDLNLEEDAFYINKYYSLIEI